MFAGGTIASVWLNKVGDLERITFDKYLVGRLLEFVTDVQFTARRIFVTYLESRVTLVHFGRPIDFADAAFEGLAQCEPRVSTVDLLGPAGRRLNR